MGLHSIGSKKPLYDEIKTGQRRIAATRKKPKVGLRTAVSVTRKLYADYQVRIAPSSVKSEYMSTQRSFQEIYDRYAARFAKEEEARRQLTILNHGVKDVIAQEMYQRTKSLHERSVKELREYTDKMNFHPYYKEVLMGLAGAR